MSFKAEFLAPETRTSPLRVWFPPNDDDFLVHF